MFCLIILLWGDLIIIMVLTIKQSESGKHLSSHFVCFQEKNFQEVLSMCLSPVYWTGMFFNLGLDDNCIVRQPHTYLNPSLSQVVIYHNCCM